MTLPGRLARLSWAVLFLAPPLLGADDVKVSAGDVEDQRFSDSRFGGLTIELKLTGAAVGDVKAVRTRLKSAKDDTGSLLYKPAKDEKAAEFEEFSADRRPGPSIHLASPGRDASAVDVTAEVELFIPSRDPGTKQKFDGFLGRRDKPIASPVLKAAKVEITPLSPAAYKSRQQANRPTKEQIAEEGKKHGASDEEIKQAIEMMDALASLNGEEPSAKSILLETKDPDGRVISVDVVKADGSELPAPSRGTSGGRDSKLVKIDLSDPPPADAVLLVTLRTAKSIVTVPVSWKGVTLP